MKSNEGSGHNHGGLRAYPTKKWRCDACGKWMDDSLAFVSWEEIGNRHTSHRITHNSLACNPGQFGHFGVFELVGSDGLSMMLGWILHGRHHARSVVEIIRRIHISRFEYVAPWFKELHNPSRVASDPNSLFLFQETLEKMLRKLEAEGWPQPRKPGRFLKPGALYAIPKIQRPRAID